MTGGIKTEMASVTFHIVMQILNDTDIEMVKCQTSNVKFNVMYILHIWVQNL